MKTDYITPVIELQEYEMEGMTCASDVTSDNGIGFGGIDDNGSIEAETRQQSKIFPFDD